MNPAVTSNAPDPAPCPGAFVAFAEHLADRARAVTLHYFRAPLDVERKSDATPVTVADRETEAALRTLVAERYPDHGVVGEEQEPSQIQARYVWVFDPIDGTKHYISGHPGFGTLIALLRDKRPILGLIDMPALDDRWVGALGHPTRGRDRRGERELRTRPCPALDGAILYSTSPLMFTGPDATAFGRLRDRVAVPLFGSDCLGYGLLASGYADLVVEANLGVYDYLPLVAVVEGSGGRITDWRGRPLSLDSDGRVLAAGDPARHAEALELLAAD